MPAPPTRFGPRHFLDQSDASISLIKWSQVVAHEPENVARWLLFLNRRKYVAIKGLLPHLIQTLRWKHEDPQPAQWNSFMRTGVPWILMDILSEPGMYSQEPGAFKNIAYGVELLSALHHCLELVALQRDNSARECAQELFQRRERFFRSLWNQKDLVLRKFFNRDQPEMVGDPRYLSARFPHSASVCVTWLMFVCRQLNETTPLSYCAAHFLLFYWTYTDYEDASDSVRWLYYLMNEDLAIPAFAHEYIASCDSEHPYYITMRAIQYLRRKDLIGDSAEHINFICSAIIINNASAFAAVPLYDETGLVPSLIHCYHRQLCSSPEWVMERYRELFPRNITALMKSASGQIMQTQVTRYAGKLNLIAIVSDTMITALKENKGHLLSRILAILIHIQSPLSSRARRHLHVRQAPEYADLERTTSKIWHITLRSLLSIHPPDAQQASLKQSCLQAWRSYGSLFGLREGVNVTSTNKASVPSNETRYWKIPKRCFWGGCACSALPKAPHHLHACKGCWRVLYCSSKCQQFDWDAGHRLVCRALPQA